MAGDDLQCQTKEKCSDEKEIEKNLKCTEWKLQENRKPQCRICLEPGADHNPLLRPCKCDGSIGFTHYSCLSTWIASRQHSDRRICELCHAKYNRTGHGGTFSSFGSQTGELLVDSSSAQKLGYFVIVLLLATVFLLFAYYEYLFQDRTKSNTNIYILTVATGVILVFWALVAVGLVSFVRTRHIAKQQRIQNDTEWELRRAEEGHAIRWTLANV